MKVLIASQDMEASHQLNQTVARMAPQATYLHAGTADRVLQLFENHRIDLVLLDLQLIAKNSAAASLLRLLNPGALAFSPLKKQLDNFADKSRPGVLLTFDGDDIRCAPDHVMSRLEDVAKNTVSKSEIDESPRIWAQTEEGDWESVDVHGLQWAVSEGGKVRLHHESDKDYFVRDRLKELETQLGAAHFLRIHKSYMVNSAQVSEVQRWSSGGLLVKIKNDEDTALPVSRRYASNFRKRTGLGIGRVKARL